MDTYDHKFQCQRCGSIKYSHKKRLDGYDKGLIVCTRCYDPPHVQDLVRAREDNPAVENASPFNWSAATVTLPTLSSATISNNEITLAFSKPVLIDDNSGWAVTVNGTPVTLRGITGVAVDWVLRLALDPGEGTAIVLSYTPGDVVDYGQNALAALSTTIQTGEESEPTDGAFLMEDGNFYLKEDGDFILTDG